MLNNNKNFDLAFFFFFFDEPKKRKTDIHKMIEKDIFYIYIYTKKMIAAYDEIKI